MMIPMETRGEEQPLVLPPAEESIIDVPSGFILKLYQMISDASDDMVKVCSASCSMCRESVHGSDVYRQVVCLGLVGVLDHQIDAGFLLYLWDEKALVFVTVVSGGTFRLPLVIRHLFFRSQPTKRWCLTTSIFTGRELSQLRTTFRCNR
jgi:hypothetical protein